MYCGIWAKKTGSEDWITGDQFILDYDIIGIRGTKELNYVVIGLTDSGSTLYSQVLNFTDAPDTFDTAVDVAANLTNYPRISYSAASGGGFIQFKIYREDVAAGTIYQIADIRNANSFVFDDLGARVNMTPSAAFPTPGSDKPQALAYSRSLAVGAFGEALVINDFTIRIPNAYNISETLAFSQFLRFGFTRTTAVNQQIRLDKIYLGPTFNEWSDSPFDSVTAIASSAPTSGTPTTGGGTGDPPPAGEGGCIRVDVPVLTLDFDGEHAWRPYETVPPGELLENGIENRNLVKQRHPARTRVLYHVQFSNGSWFDGSKDHRLRLDKAGNCKALRLLNAGDKVWGWNNGREGYTIITAIGRCLYKKEQRIGTFMLVGTHGETDHFYIAGFSHDKNSGVFHHNRKADPGDPIIS